MPASEDLGFPVIPVADEAALIAGGWADAARAALETQGGLVLKTDLDGADIVQRALARIDPELLDDAFWSTPRTRIADKTLTATEYPAPRTIPLHSEMSYLRAWPRFIAFHAIVAADRGGETMICDLDRTSADLPGALLARFRDCGVRYRRTFQPRVDVPWRQAFQTDRRDDVDRLAARLGMTTAWDGDRLTTSHIAQGAIAAANGAPILFNQAHLFHPSALAADTRAMLEKICGRDRLPRMAAYGDGSAIDEGDLDLIRAAFDRHVVDVRWRAGGVLILDNMRFAHGRRPFTGARRLHVALARQETATVRPPAFPSR